MKWISLSFLLLICCAPTSQEAFDQQAIGRAYRYIDQGQEQRAIDLLGPLVIRNPSDQEARVALASAYVSLAQLPFHKFYEFAKTFVMTGREGDAGDAPFLKSILNLTKDQVPEAQAQRIEEMLKKYFGAIRELLIFLDRFQKIPLVAVANVGYLNTAIEILQGTPRPSAGTALYRALLRAVQFKFAWNEEGFVRVRADCLVDMDSTIAGIAQINGRIAIITQDLIIAFPRKQPQIIKIQSQIASTSREVSHQLELRNFQWFNINELLGEQRCSPSH